MNEAAGALDANTCWELWNLRALRPDADLPELLRLRRLRERIAAHETRALALIGEQSERFLTSGRRFLAEHPDLRSGLIVTMHIGPYQFVPEPLLNAECAPALLLNQDAFANLAVKAEQMRLLLELAGRLDWIPIESAFFVRRMVAALRTERPVIVFLDGNGGLGGPEKTRESGMLYHLPGRDIRVRTGLGRLIHRLGCPVHTVVARWDEDGGIVWNGCENMTWSPGSGPRDITRRLYDWGIGEVLAAPEQWNYWGMLKESYACFAPDRLGPSDCDSGRRLVARHEFETSWLHRPQETRVVLADGVEIWPGDVLADSRGDRFYAAEGLSADALAQLRCGERTLAELSRRHGPAWVRFHVLRLCLLGLVRLEGLSRAG